MKTTLLLIEPDSLLRRTVGGVCRELGFTDVHEAASVDSGERLLAAQAGRCHALLLALGDDGRGLELLARVRSGAAPCPRNVAVAVMAAGCDAALALRLKELDVKRLLLKPYKVKSVIETIAGLAAAR